MLQHALAAWWLIALILWMVMNALWAIRCGWFVPRIFG